MKNLKAAQEAEARAAEILRITDEQVNGFMAQLDQAKADAAKGDKEMAAALKESDMPKYLSAKEKRGKALDAQEFCTAKLEALRTGSLIEESERDSRCAAIQQEYEKERDKMLSKLAQLSEEMHQIGEDLITLASGANSAVASLDGIARRGKKEDPFNGWTYTQWADAGIASYQYEQFTGKSFKRAPEKRYSFGA